MRVHLILTHHQHRGATENQTSKSEIPECRSYEKGWTLSQPRIRAPVSGEGINVLGWHGEWALGGEDMWALPREHAHCGMLARFKLSSQGTQTVREHHLPSSPLVPHLCMSSWHRQIFCALADSRQILFPAETARHVRPNSA